VWKEGATTVPVRTLFLEQGEGVLAARFAKEGPLIIAIIGNANTGKALNTSEKNDSHSTRQARERANFKGHLQRDQSCDMAGEPS